MLQSSIDTRLSRRQWIGALASSMAVGNVGWLTAASAPTLADDRQEVIRAVLQTAHGRRVAEEIRRVSAMSADELKSSIDDTWTVFASGVQDGNSPDPQLIFPQLLACRLRRRFIQTIDARAADEKKALAGQIHNHWMKQQKQHMDLVLASFRDPANPAPPGRGIGLRLAVATGLFCCARWSTARDVASRIKASHDYAKELSLSLQDIPSLNDLQRMIIPRLVAPDHSCRVSILAYAVERDPSVPGAVSKEFKKLLGDLEVREQVSWRSVEWNAWDASIDWFDIVPLKLDPDAIGRRATDERFRW